MTEKNNPLKSKSTLRSKDTQSSSGTEAPQSSALSPQSCDEQSLLLITGGCGFIGLNFLDFMLKKGFTNFRILDNLSVGQIEDLESLLSEHGDFGKHEENNKITYTLSPSQSSLLSPQPLSESSVLSTQSSQAPCVQLVIADIRNPNDCLMSTKNVSAVVHLAAQSGVPTSVENPVFDCETNVLGTLNILEACRKNAVRNFIFASSGAPLGEVEPPIHEEKVPHPVSPYGASKLAGEAYCSAYHKTFGIKTVALRFGNVYGPRSNHKSSVVAKFFKRAFEGLPLEIYGDGAQTRDFIYVEDLCNAIYLSLNTLGLRPEVSPNHVAGEVFQIATNVETTVNEIVDKIKGIIETYTCSMVSITHSEKRLGDVLRSFSDTSKAKEMLTWNYAWSLEAGLRVTFE